MESRDVAWGISRDVARYVSTEGLFKEFRGELGQIDAPVLPDVATLALVILIFVAVVVQLLAVIDIALIQEVCLADSDPIEFRLLAELDLQLVIHVLVDG